MTFVRGLLTGATLTVALAVTLRVRRRGADRRQLERLRRAG